VQRLAVDDTAEITGIAQRHINKIDEKWPRSLFTLYSNSVLCHKIIKYINATHVEL